MAFDGCCPDCKLPGDDCPLGKICRMAFDGCCPDCKLPGDDCPLGKICRMAFDGCCPDCKLPGDDCPLGKICHMTLDGCCPDCKLPGDDCPYYKNAMQQKNLLSVWLIAHRGRVEVAGCTGTGDPVLILGIPSPCLGPDLSSCVPLMARR